MLADLADAGHADRPAVQGRGAPGPLGRGAHALEDAEGGEHRGVAGPAVRDRAAGDERALAGDVVHVLAEGADVAGGVVAAVERLHEAAVGAQQGLGLDPGRVADDHGLAAAEVEPGQRRLVGHPAGEVEDVVERVLLGGVGVEAGAAQGRAERGGVDGDDRLQPGRLVVAEHDLLMAGGPGEDAGGGGRYVRCAGHGGDPSLVWPAGWAGCSRWCAAPRGWCGWDAGSSLGRVVNSASACTAPHPDRRRAQPARRRTLRSRGSALPAPGDLDHTLEEH